MTNNISQKNRRALVVGVIGVALILLVTYVVLPWLDVRDEIAKTEEALAKLIAEKSAEPNEVELNRAVPAFEMPRTEDEQRLLFVRKVGEQFKKGGIKITGMPEFKSQPSPQSDLELKMLRLDCSGKCKFDQALDLMAGLYENPYLVAVEYMNLKCASDNRQEWQLSLTVSTFVQ